MMNKFGKTAIALALIALPGGLLLGLLLAWLRHRKVRQAMQQLAA